MTQLWLYLHFYQLQLDKLFVTDNSQAVAIVDPRQHQIVQRNEQASQHGIEVGMGLATAALLHQDIQVIAYNNEQEQQALQEIASWLYLSTSDISLYPPQGLLLRVHPMLMMYQGLDNYWLAIEQQLARLNIHYHYASGPSPLAARMLAINAHNQLCADKQQAMQILYEYPLSRSELAAKQQEKLARVGIRTLQDLIRLPLADIARRFDIDLVNYIGRLRGELQHPQTFYLPPARFEQQLPLLYEIEQTQYLQRPLQHLFTQLEQFLRWRDCYCTELELQLIQRDNAPVILSVHSAQGDYLAATWQKLTALRLENIQLTAPVTDLKLKALHITSKGSEVSDLFDGRQGVMRPLQLLSLLQAKLGREAVSSPAVADDFRPERACTYLPALQQADLPAQLHSQRPILLLPKPQPLTDKVQVMYGPERICSGWWDEQPILRDYFIARSPDGRWCWIYRQADQRWFLQGYFA